MNCSSREPNDTYGKPPHGWTCFFCGETFTTSGAARDHFGADPLADAACRIKAGEERGLVMALRKAEAELARYQAEDSDADRRYYAQQAEHAAALRRAEEDGYAKGVHDARFQRRVAPWMQACFGPQISADTGERNHRFLEEALELVQSCGCTESEAHQLVAYVFGRPAGETRQEVGGVMITLAALCLAHGIDMHEAGDVELARVWTKIGEIQAKQASKPKHSPLPESVFT